MKVNKHGLKTFQPFVLEITVENQDEYEVLRSLCKQSISDVVGEMESSVMLSQTQIIKILEDLKTSIER